MRQIMLVRLTRRLKLSAAARTADQERLEQQEMPEVALRSPLEALEGQEALEYQELAVQQVR